MHATGIYPPWFHYMPDSLFLLATAYRIVYSVLGSYLTVRLAPHRPMLHALILGVVGVLLSIAGAVSTWNKGPEFGPKWYPITLIVIAIPLAWSAANFTLSRPRNRNESLNFGRVVLSVIWNCSCGTGIIHCANDGPPHTPNHRLDSAVYNRHNCPRRLRRTLRREFN